jgi:cytochrome P450
MDWKERLQWALVPLLVRFDRLRFGTAYAPLERRHREDPYPMYAELRERAPWLRSSLTRGWVVSRYDDVSAVLRDPRFSALDRNNRNYAQFRKRLEQTGVLQPGEQESFSMLRSDPPEHTRLRTLVNKAFTPRAIDQWRGRIVNIVDELLEQAAKQGRIELVRDFAAPVPMLVIAEMLGVPGEDRDQFKAWSTDVVRTLGFATIEDMHAWKRASRELRAYLAGVAAERRATPRGDLISAMVQAEEAGERLSEEDLLATCELLLVAGNETTTNLISNSLAALLRHPQQLQAVRDDPALLELGIDELLRYDSPVQATSRIALEDLDICGRRAARGEELLLLLGSANRDPLAFDEPDRLDLARGDTRHLAFSQGIHFCLGAQLARLEARIAIGALVERFPSMRLADSPIEWGGNVILRGPSRLVLELS